MGKALPPEIRQAQMMVESGCQFTFTEYENMPVDLVELIILYKTARSAKLASD